MAKRRLATTADQLSRAEIAIIKRMQKLGKLNGFHNQEILSYFSRPGRSINPARIKEIEEGSRGGDVEPASETELADFLAQFNQPSGNGETIERPSFPDLPPPSRIGVVDRQIDFIPPGAARDSEVCRLREELSASVKSQCDWFAENLHRLQVDQSLVSNVCEIKSCLDERPDSVNATLLFSAFRVTRRVVDENSDGFSAQANERWKVLDENLNVLLETYPSFKKYRETALALKGPIALDETEVQSAITVLRSEDGEALVAPRIAEAIEKLNNIQADNEQNDKQRNLGIQSLLVRVVMYVPVLSKILPMLDDNQKSARNLYAVLTPVVRAILDRAGMGD